MKSFTFDLLEAEFGGDVPLHIQQLYDVKGIQSTGRAFAATLADKSVVTWGHHLYGGNSQEIQGQLRSVVSLQCTGAACAAQRQDGKVMTWGFKARVA